jgi:hypothetical protein
LETSVTKHNVLDNDPTGVLVTKVILNGEEHVVDPVKGFGFETELGGGVRIMQDGTFTYVAPVRYNSGVGTDIDGPDVDHFQYVAIDANGKASAPTDVNINILDTVPIAADDVYTLTDINAAMRFHVDAKEGVMKNDTQSADYVLKAEEGSIQNIVWKVRPAEGAAEVEVPAGSYNPGGAHIVTTANGGQVWINQDGSFEYLPKPHFEGEDSFQYQLTDGDNSPSNWATVTFHVPGPPTPPIAVEDNYEVLETSVTKHNVLDNDPTGVLVTKVILNGKEYNVDPVKGFEFETELGGGVKIMPDGTFTYVAPVRYNSGVGTDIDGPDVDHFQYIAKDASGNLSDPTMVNINILDTVPIANDDDYTLADINAAMRFQSNVMDNDIQSADYVLVAGKDSIQNIVWQVRTAEGSAEIDVPAGSYNPGGQAMLETAEGGKVWINQDGSFEYVPPPRFEGEDSFQYQLTDGDNSPSDWATVTIHVPGPETPPAPPTIHDGGADYNDLSGTDGIVDVFKWSLADLGNGDSVMNTINGFNAADGDRLDLRDLLQDGDDYLFDTAHLNVFADNSGNTMIEVSPVDSEAPSLNIMVAGVDLTGGYQGQEAIDQLLKNGNLVDDR